MELKIYLAMLLIGGSSYCFAQTGTQNEPSKDAFITQFMQAYTANDAVVLKKLLTNGAKITIPGKSEQIAISKSDYLQLIKQTGKEQQSCSTSYKIISSTVNALTAQVYFVYSSYAIQNTIKAENKSGTWKITELIKAFMPGSQPAIVKQ